MRHAPITKAILAAATLAMATAPGAATVVLEANPNDVMATAQDLDGHFGLEPNSNIINSTTVPHATVDSWNTYENQFDYYRFTVTGLSTGYFDIDFANNNVIAGFDSFLRLFDVNGNSLASNDNSASDPGSPSNFGGSSFDANLTYDFTQAGTYFLRVGGCCEQAFNGGYELHVSLANSVVSGVPEPSTWATMLLGFGAIGVGLRRRRKSVRHLKIA